MAILNIPKEHQESLDALAALPSFEIDNLLSVLSELPLSIDLDTSTKMIASKIRSSAIKNPEAMAQAIISLSVTRAHSNTPVESFAEDILQALARSGHRPVINGEKDPARENLISILRFEPLEVVAKAYHLLHDQERTVSGKARILTDARPIFGQEIGSPVAFLINHVLKLPYSKDGRSSDFFVALDAADIADLRNALERAEAKAESLKKAFAVMRTPVVQS